MSCLLFSCICGGMNVTFCFCLGPVSGCLASDTRTLRLHRNHQSIELWNCNTTRLGARKCRALSFMARIMGSSHPSINATHCSQGTASSKASSIASNTAILRASSCRCWSLLSGWQSARRPSQIMMPLPATKEEGHSGLSRCLWSKLTVAHPQHANKYLNHREERKE